MKKYFVIFIVSVFFADCKKREPTTETGVTNDFPAIYSKKGYGLLQVRKVVDLVNGTIYDNLNSPGLNHCLFFDSLSDYNYTGTAHTVDLGQVFLNGIEFGKSVWFNPLASTMYFDATSSRISFPLNWKITGDSSFNSCNIQISGDYPSYNGYTLLPDTIYLLNGVNIPLANISGDLVEVYIDDGSSSFTNSKFVEKPFSSVSFSSSEFVPFNSSINGDINIIVYKNNLRTLNNRVYNFRVGYHLIKRNVILRY